MDANMQLTISSFRPLFSDKIFSPTLLWLFVKSLTFPCFPDKCSPWIMEQCSNQEWWEIREGCYQLWVALCVSLTCPPRRSTYEWLALFCLLLSAAASSQRCCCCCCSTDGNDVGGSRGTNTGLSEPDHTHTRTHCLISITTAKAFQCTSKYR